MLAHLVGAAAVAAYLGYMLVTSALPYLLLVTPTGWQQKIEAALKSPKLLVLTKGWKRSSYRRRLVCASRHPSYYTNFETNKVTLCPQDKAPGFELRLKNRDPEDPRRPIVYGFFHPYANNGGGGEKVLWHAIEATLVNLQNIVVVYTSNIEASPLNIVNKAREKFGLTGLREDRIVFIYLRKYARLIDTSFWTHFTLIGQIFGLFLLAWEALLELSPDVWVDTIGLPGSYVLPSLALHIPIVSYVHYPIIQEDMFRKLPYQDFASLSKVRSVRDAKHAAKFLYWLLMRHLYVLLGSLVDIVFANGTWTYNHIRSIWRLNKSVSILYPPCTSESLASDEKEAVLITKERTNAMIYIAQFRPEKRHSLILSEYSKFLHKLPAKAPHMPHVVLLGSCRTPTDVKTLNETRALATELGISDRVEFIVDCSYEEIQRKLAEVKFGLNAMWNEHFGIAVVEYLSSGVIPIVHASAGPHMDIAQTDGPSPGWKSDIGYFFKSESDPDYEGTSSTHGLLFQQDGETVMFPTLADLLERIYTSPEELNESQMQLKRKLGISLMKQRFSNEAFARKWTEALQTAEILERMYRKDKRDKVTRFY